MDNAKEYGRIIEVLVPARCESGKGKINTWNNIPLFIWWTLWKESIFFQDFGKKVTIDFLKENQNL